MSTGYEYTEEFRLNFIGKPVEVRAYKREENGEAGALGVVLLGTLRKVMTVVQSDDSLIYYISMDEAGGQADFQASSNDVVLTVRTRGN